MDLRIGVRPGPPAGSPEAVQESAQVRKRWTSSSSTSASSARGSGLQPDRSTATERAAQISFIRVSRNRPNRLTRMATETLSTESRFTAERRGTGSLAGSSTISLSRPRIVVVHGATSARRCRGITASREGTTTGRRPISTISHHHTSPGGGERGHERATARRNDFRSPQASGSSSGCLS